MYLSIFILNTLFRTIRNCNTDLIIPMNNVQVNDALAT